MKAYEQGIPPEDWDENQRRLGAHMLQSRFWALFQERLGREVVWARGDGWSWFGVITRGRGVRYLYLPYGPTVRSAATLELAMKSVEAAARNRDLDFVRCEPVGVPQAAVERLGLVQVKEVQPQHSLMIDLDQDEASLRSALSASHRNTINGADRRGISFRKSSNPADVADFLELIHATARDRGITPHPDRYYRVMLESLMPDGSAKLFFAEHVGKVISATIVFDDRGIRGYAHTGNDPQARKLRATAPLVWFMMLDAKASGLHSFDLWGIAPAGAAPNHPWQGFTEFKRAFGGEEITYAGTWELPLKPLKYRAVRLVKRLRG